MLQNPVSPKLRNLFKFDENCLKKVGISQFLITLIILSLFAAASSAAHLGVNLAVSLRSHMSPGRHLHNVPSIYKLSRRLYIEYCVLWMWGKLISDKKRLSIFREAVFISWYQIRWYQGCGHLRYWKGHVDWDLHEFFGGVFSEFLIILIIISDEKSLSLIKKKENFFFQKKFWQKKNFFLNYLYSISHW